MPLGTVVGLGPGVLDGGPSSPYEGAQPPLTYRPKSIVAKRSPISVTAEHLFLFSSFSLLPLLGLCALAACQLSLVM